MSEQPGRVVEVRVRLDAVPEVVFGFLTREDRYIRWQGVKASLDPRRGGVYRVWMEQGAVASGEFVEVEPNRRVVFTWGWEGDPAVPPGSTTVEIDLAPDGDGTLLTLRHLGLPDEASAAMHEEGWRMFTARLAEVVAPG